MADIDNIIGADRLIEHFGAWPSFHDAEVVRLVLDRRGANGPTAEMLVHTVLGRYSLVRFEFEQITSCELSDFNHQNVLFHLRTDPETAYGKAAVRVTLDSSSGLVGSIVCRRLVVAAVRACDAQGNELTNG
jgi:immunity protein 50 of polymorphic toxin system